MIKIAPVCIATLNYSWHGDKLFSSINECLKILLIHLRNIFPASACYTGGMPSSDSFFAVSILNFTDFMSGKYLNVKNYVFAGEQFFNDGLKKIQQLQWHLLTFSGRQTSITLKTTSGLIFDCMNCICRYWSTAFAVLAIGNNKIGNNGTQSSGNFCQSCRQFSSRFDKISSGLTLPGESDGA
jgi:hypothetical protein